MREEKKKLYREDPIINEEIGKLEHEMESEGRVLIRSSGTEPVIRVMIEGKDENKIYEKAKRLSNIIEDRLN